MNDLKKTVIIRHRRENLKKCTLKGLENNSNFIFLNYPFHTIPPLEKRVVLTIDAPFLTYEDRDLGLLLIDGTWRLANQIEKNLPPGMEKRSLPPYYSTAYPRKQTACTDPTRGLASIEALYVAFSILKKECNTLLDHYHWRELFLQKNGMKHEM